MSPDAEEDDLGASSDAAPTSPSRSDWLAPAGPLSVDSEVPDSQASPTTPTEADPLLAQSPVPTLHAPGIVLEASAPHTDDATAVGSMAGTTPDSIASPASHPLTVAQDVVEPSSNPTVAARPSPPSMAQIGRAASARFASPPIMLQRSRQRRPATTWTLGEFLSAATKHLCAALPTPGKRPRRPALNFFPRRGRSASSVVATAKAAAPPTAEHRAQVQVLRTLGIVGINQKITAAEMSTYDGVFAAPIPRTVLSAIAALVDCELPPLSGTAPIAATPDGGPIAA